MKKTFIIIAVLMALGTPSYASSVSQHWIKTYGTSNDDIIHCIQQTIDGGYIAVGNTRTDPASAIDLLITKLDVNGNFLWQKIYPYGTWINDAYAVQQTSDGGYIVAGFTGNVGFGAGWILNLDSNGDILWQKAYDGVAQFKSIHQTADGGYIAAGDVVKADDSADVVVVKLTSDGNITWAKQYNFADADDTNDVLQTDDGGYILTVYAPGVRILKLDNDGKIVWQKSYSGSDTALSIQQTNDGGYIVAGLQNSGCCDDDAMAFKLDSSGAIVWQRKYISSNGDVYLTHIKQTTDGDYTAVGYMSVNSVNWRDILALHLDSSGNIIWQKTYGGLSEDFGTYFGKTIDGGTIIAGNTFTDGIGDLMILKLDRSGEIPDCNIINTADIEAASSSMTSYTTTATPELPSITIVDTDSSPQDVSFNSSLLCYYDDPNDIDGDGVKSNPGREMASSMYSSSFLADGDNCSDIQMDRILALVRKVR